MDDMQGRFVLLPPPHSWRPKDGIDSHDDTGHFIMRGLSSSQNHREGFRVTAGTIEPAAQSRSDKIALRAPLCRLAGSSARATTYEWKQQGRRSGRLRQLRFWPHRHAILDDQERTCCHPCRIVEGRKPEQLPDIQRIAIEKSWQPPPGRQLRSITLGPSHGQPATKPRAGLHYTPGAGLWWPPCSITS